jgi:hypothetical protein
VFGIIERNEIRIGARGFRRPDDEKVILALKSVGAGTPECLTDCAQPELRIKTARQVEPDLSRVNPVQAQPVTTFKPS